MATDNKPKNLEEALLLIDDLNLRLSTANQTIAQQKVDVKAADAQVEALSKRLDAANEQVALLRSAVGSAGGGNLPKEVVEDIRRRMDLGLSAPEATHAALRQHQHDKDEVKRKEARQKAQDQVAGKGEEAKGKK